MPVESFRGAELSGAFGRATLTVVQSFLVQSLIASIVLTALVNLVPRLFPNASRRAEQKMADTIQDRMAEPPGRSATGVKVFFPWKLMLAVSVGLTVLLNVIGILFLD